jgi:hypothetical protein
MFYGLAKMIRAGVVSRMSFYGSLPVIDRRKPDIQISFLGGKHYPRGFSPGPAKHINNNKFLFHPRPSLVSGFFSI